MRTYISPGCDVAYNNGGGRGGLTIEVFSYNVIRSLQNVICFMLQEMCWATGEYYWFHDDVHFVLGNVFLVNKINKNLPRIHTANGGGLHVIYVSLKTISGVG